MTFVVARSLIAGDAVISTNRAIEPELAARIETRLRDAGATAVRSVELGTMARAAQSEKTRMVELRAVEPGFPYYGALKLQGQPYDHALLRGFGVLVRPELLAQLDVAVGNTLVIGTGRFTIRGVIESEPGRRLGAFSLGPRVFIDIEDLRKAGLLTFGARASYQQLLRVPDAELDALVLALRRDFAETFVRVRSYKSTEDDIGEDFARAENYMSLVGLVIVILGGIGVSSVTRVFVQQKMRSIAILKCVGARSGQLLAVYMAQVTALGLVGSAVGVLLAGAAISAIPAVLAARPTPNVQVEYGLTSTAVAQGLGIGLLVSVLFSLVPLLDVRHVKPSLLLREESPPRRLDLLGILVTGAVVLGLLGLTVWQAGSLRVGLVVAAGFVGATAVLHLAGTALIRAMAPLAHARWFPLRHAVLQLSRPGSQARIVILAVGLGSFFIVGVRSLQETLVRELTVDIAADSPDMFLLDVQSDQV
ncbi:MAG: FtsX-like permease family protein, partial [Acidobacteria bacterium]|nr:FtsX-like permease family protein [Acidobacteriota bacterium]